MSVDQRTSDVAGALGHRLAPNSGAIWLAVGLIGVAIAFWTGLASLPGAWSRPEYSYGYLIPPIAIYLLLTRLEAIPETGAVPRRGLGVAAVIVGLLLGVFGDLTQIPDINTYGLILCVSGLVLIAFGTRNGLRLWPALIYLAFMLPLPRFLYWPLSTKLQLISSEAGVGLVSALGIPVYLNGNVIDLGTYQLQVAEACSGLRYLFPLMSFGFLFAVLYRGAVWQKVTLFLSSAAIAVGMNAVRIAIVGVLVDRYGIGQAEGFLHYFEGWVIFIACLGLLLGEAVLLQKVSRRRRRVGDMLEVDVPSLGRQGRRVLGLPASSALSFAVVAILAVGIGWQFAPTRGAVSPSRDPLVLFPSQLGAWQGKQSLLDRDIEQTLAADDYLSSDYVTNGAAAPVSLFIAYYRQLTEGYGIHTPAVCLPGSGWEISRWTTVNTGVRRPNGETLVVNRAVIQQGGLQELVYYWFQERGRAMTNDFAAKVSTVADSILRRRVDGGIVRLITPINLSEAAPTAAADARLRGMLELVLPQLPAFLPD